MGSEICESALERDLSQVVTVGVRPAAGGGGILLDSRHPATGWVYSRGLPQAHDVALSPKPCIALCKSLLDLLA